MGTIQKRKEHQALSLIERTELGKLKFGVPHSFSVDLKNESEHNITITSLTPSCGACTTARIDRSIILSGETLKVHLIFTPGSTGNLVKAVNIYYELNGRSHSTHIKFAANVS